MAKDKAPASVAVNADDIERFFDIIFQQASKDGCVPLRAFPDLETGGAFLEDAVPLDDPQWARSYIYGRAVEAGRASKPIVFCPPLVVTEGISAREADVVEGLTITVELDKDPQVGLARLVQRIGAPTVLVASGGLTKTGEERLHAHWVLRVPARGGDRARLKRARFLAAILGGGDRTAVPLGHPIRWPGSLHCKDPERPRVARILQATPNQLIDLEPALEALAEATGQSPLVADAAEGEAGNLRAPRMTWLRRVVMGIENADLEWDEWNAIGMGIHNASGGTEAGLRIFTEWSKTSPKYRERETAARWAHWEYHGADYLGWQWLWKLSGVTSLSGPEVEARAREKMRERRLAAAARAEEAEAPARVEETPARVEEDDGGHAAEEPEERPETAEYSRARAELIEHLGQEDWLALVDICDGSETEPLFMQPEDIDELLVEVRAKRLADKKALAGRLAPDPEIIDRLPPGVFREVVEAAYERLDRDVHELALMAVLTGASGLCTSFVVSGRRLTPLTMWPLLLAPSGVGKGTSIEIVSEMLACTGGTTSSLPNSAEGIHRHFLMAAEKDDLQSDSRGQKIPTMVVTIDEIGKWLPKVRGRGADPGAGAAFGFALSLYNQSVGPNAYIRESSRADARNTRERVDNPALVLAGFTVADTYVRLLGPEMIRGGYANRALHFCVERVGPRRPVEHRPPRSFPTELLVALQHVRDMTYTMSREQGYEERLFERGAPHNKAMRAIDISLDQERRIRVALEALEAWMAKHGQDLALAARYAEQVIKIAGIITAIDAAGEDAVMEVWRGRRLQVSDAAIDYAIWLVDNLLRRFCHVLEDAPLTDDPLSDGTHLADDLVDACLFFLQNPSECVKQGRDYSHYPRAGWVPLGMVVRRLRITSRQANEALEQAQELGIVEVASEDTAARLHGGRRGATPRLIRPV